MIRKIIHIDQEKCNGCGACANACHEGAIEMVNGKAVLTNEHYRRGIFLSGSVCLGNWHGKRKGKTAAGGLL